MKKAVKKILLISFLIVQVNILFAQTDTTSVDINEDSEVEHVDSTKTRKSFFKRLFSKSDKNKDDDDEDADNDEDDNEDGLENDSIAGSSNPNDSIMGSSGDSISSKSKSGKNKKLNFFQRLFKKKDYGVGEEPPEITRKTWNEAEDRDARMKMLGDWVKYDIKYYFEGKYKITPKERKILQTRVYKDLSIWDKMRYRRAARKPEKAARKIQKRKIKRLKRVVKYYNTTAKRDSADGKANYDILVMEREHWGMKEALRKEKVRKKYDKKEVRARRRYGLNLEEHQILNEATGRRLRGAKKRSIYRKAKYKQGKLTEKLDKIKKDRNFAMQSKKTRKKLKAQRKAMKKRDKKRKNK